MESSLGHFQSITTNIKKELINVNVIKKKNGIKGNPKKHSAVHVICQNVIKYSIVLIFHLNDAPNLHF